MYTRHKVYYFTNLIFKRKIVNRFGG